MWAHFAIGRNKTRTFAQSLKRLAQKIWLHFSLNQIANQRLKIISEFSGHKIVFFLSVILLASSGTNSWYGFDGYDLNRWFVVARPDYSQTYLCLSRLHSINWDVGLIALFSFFFVNKSLLASSSVE